MDCGVRDFLLNINTYVARESHCWYKMKTEKMADCKGGMGNLSREWPDP